MLAQSISADGDGPARAARRFHQSFLQSPAPIDHDSQQWSLYRESQRVAICAGVLPLAYARHSKRGSRCSASFLAGRSRLPNPPAEGRTGLAHALRAAGARTILPDMRGFGASDKPREKEAYADSAMARDVLVLIEHLRLDAVDVIGFSMGCGTTAGLLMLHPPQVKSAILAGVGDYVIQDTVMDFPKKLADSGLCSATHHRPGLGRGGSKDSGRGRNCSRTPRLGRSDRGSRYRRRPEGACSGNSRRSRPAVVRRGALQH